MSDTDVQTFNKLALTAGRAQLNLSAEGAMNTSCGTISEPPQSRNHLDSLKICRQPSLSLVFVFRNRVVWFCSWGDVNKSLLTRERELRTEQTRDATRVQVCEPVSFTGVVWRSVGKGYLWEGLKVSSSPKTQHSWVAAHNSGKPVAICSREGNSAGEYPFNVALVVWVSSWKLCLSEHDTRILTISTCLGEGEL